MTDIIKFFVPGKPISRKAPSFGKGRAYHDDSSREVGWHDRVHAAALQARAEQGKIEGPVMVMVVFIFPAPRRVKVAYPGEPGAEIKIVRPGGLGTFFPSGDSTYAHTNRPDVDNLLKLVVDAIQNVVIDDDKMIWIKTGIKVWGRKG